MRSPLAVLAAAIFALAACGTTETAAPEPATSGGTAAPVTVTDSLGRQVKLDRPATRVVSLEWGETEMLASLGVMPVGAADVKGYATWNTAAKLDPSVKDVGNRQEPSVDSIAALQPDLVVMQAARDSALVPQLEKFVPVLVTKGADAGDDLKRMSADLTMIATAVGKTTEATGLLADLDAALADGKERIAAAGAAGRAFVMADGWKEGSTISIRPFGQGSLVSQVAGRLGLKNAWTGKVDEVGAWATPTSRA
ncbi:ABC transporter substrate-binding protein [Nonomuraea cypriaca]|uniref:ABC transporter substrate-binding protein n=1 Tax=Nonomuraea cypriaca TaxID=1187855 RepID=UPI001F483459|nr:ABC transporter substrate-binding protein [Nonomuraea cypriaca]